MLKVMNSQHFEERGHAILEACKYAETAKLYRLRDDIIARQRQLNEEMRRLVRVSNQITQRSKP